MSELTVIGHDPESVDPDPRSGRMETPILVRLRGLRPSLSPAQDRVADVLLSDAGAAPERTITELAVAAQTSETTVLRLCHRLELKGYPQLRLAIAVESATPRAAALSGGDISAKDSIDDVIAKVAAVDASAVAETAQQLDRAALVRAADALAGAGRVDIYGIAASAIVGADLQQKLHRIGVVSFAWNDPHVALTSASALGRKDLAIGISHSGTTSETVETLTAARERGACTVAITNFPTSPLARVADIVLTTAARETPLRSGATGSRIAALMVVDCLFVAVAQRNLNRARRVIDESRKAVASHQVK